MTRTELREQAKAKLLGDRISTSLQKVGADRVAKAYEQLTGRPCGCVERTALLNNWDAQWRAK